jgi:DNA-3-methyladenine glycosylase II
MPDALSFTPECDGALYLKKVDPLLGALIDTIGRIDLPLRKQYFHSLVRSIVGQQISGAAANAIMKRLESDQGSLCAHDIVDRDLTQAGLSRRKAEYVRTLADNVLSARLDLDSLDRLPDEEVIAALSTQKGIGRWTAEMFLIFSLGRPDVFAVLDLGLRRGVRLLYDLEQMPTPQQVQEMSSNWKPYRTAASLYLWQLSRLKAVPGS